MSCAKQKLNNSLPVFSSADVNDLNYNGFLFHGLCSLFAVNFSPKRSGTIRKENLIKLAFFVSFDHTHKNQIHDPSVVVNVSKQLYLSVTIPKV